LSASLALCRKCTGSVGTGLAIGASSLVCVLPMAP